MENEAENFILLLILSVLPPDSEKQKLAEADQALRAFEWLMERLYEARPDLRPEPEPQAEQPSLLEAEAT